MDTSAVTVSSGIMFPHALTPEPIGTAALGLLAYSSAALTTQVAQISLQMSQGLFTATSLPSLLPMPASWQLDPPILNAPNTLALGPMLPSTPLTTSTRLQQLVAQPVQPCCSQPHQQHGHSTIFFAGVTPIVSAEALLAVFANFGRVMDLNLFRPYKGCRTSKGCGLVVFSQHGEALAALEALNGRFVWPGARSPMVVEWCDPSKQQKRKRAQPLAPSLAQQVAALQQKALPVSLPTVPLSLGFLATGNAGRLVMPGH